MAKEIILPKLGNSVEECIIMRWNKTVGDSVVVDELLCEVETDKTTMDVLSTEEGVLRHQFYKVDDVVKILQPIAIVGSADEAIDNLLAISAEQDGVAFKEIANSTPEKQVDKADRSSGKFANKAQLKVASTNSTTKVNNTEYRLSPRAKRWLGLHGITAEHFMQHFPVSMLVASNKLFLEEQDIISIFQQYSSISPTALRALIANNKMLDLPKAEKEPNKMGSGINGRIVSEDIETLNIVVPRAAVASSSTVQNTNNVSATEAQTANYLAAMQNVAEESRSPIKGMRKVISDRMMQSLESTAQLTLHMQAKASKITQARTYYKSNNIAISINDMLVYIVAQVLKKELWANLLLIDNTLIRYSEINLGIAVQTPRGLMVPVVANADKKDVQTLADEIRVLAGQCKEASISAEKLQGATFTITNLGAYGVQQFTPILNAPQTGILGLGCIDIRAIELLDGSYGFEPCINLSFTFDHRAYDGADAAKLLKAFSDSIAEYEI